jgi:hypothetical protein
MQTEKAPGMFEVLTRNLACSAANAHERSHRS